MNLRTHGWRLNRQAVPATLLDLAARRQLTTDQVSDDTIVRVRLSPGDVGSLTDY